MRFEIEADFLGPISCSSSKVRFVKFIDGETALFEVQADGNEQAIISLLTGVAGVESNEEFWLSRLPTCTSRYAALGYRINPSSGIPELIREDW